VTTKVIDLDLIKILEEPKMSISTTIIDNLLNLCTAVVTQAFVDSARGSANYVRGFATKARGINVKGNTTMYRKNIGLAEDIDALALVIQRQSLNEYNPAKFIEQGIAKAQKLLNQAVAPRF